MEDLRKDSIDCHVFRLPSLVPLHSEFSESFKLCATCNKRSLGPVAIEVNQVFGGSSAVKVEYIDSVNKGITEKYG